MSKLFRTLVPTVFVAAGLAGCGTTTSSSPVELPPAVHTNPPSGVAPGAPVGPDADCVPTRRSLNCSR